MIRLDGREEILAKTGRRYFSLERDLEAVFPNFDVKKNWQNKHVEKPVVRVWCFFKHGSDRENDASTVVWALGYPVL